MRSKISFRSRNDLLHVDSFPTRPSGGKRLLRVFMNVNFSQSRVWITSDNFEQLAHQYGREAGLPGRPGLWARFRNQSRALFSSIGLPISPRSDAEPVAIAEDVRVLGLAAIERAARR